MVNFAILAEKLFRWDCVTVVGLFFLVTIVTVYCLLKG